MDLGGRIKAARLEAGLSQRQLCGDTITRNMLSQIENGTARPSMATLSYLAGRLGKPISFFLEEQTVTSPNKERMADARRALANGDGAAVTAALEGFREPDETFREERQLLLFLGYLQMARRAIRESRKPYAVSILKKAQALQGIYITAQLRRDALLLLGRAGEAVELPGEDEALLLRAERAAPQRAVVLLEAAEDHTSERWNLLRGQAEFALGQYADAAVHLGRAEAAYPETVYPKLEACYRELGDFRLAYEYACKQRTDN